LSLSNYKESHFPGFLVIDLPASLVDGSVIKDKENFIVEPFIQLLHREDMKDCQVIFTGQAFEGIDEVNRIEFSKIWV
jgi:hypothetical protein